MNQITESSSPARKSRKAALFFWGTIVAMMLGTLGLQFAGSRHSSNTASEARGDNATPTPAEATAEGFRNALETTPDAVLDQVLPELDPLLDGAFQPVYDKIESYTDFHYSIRGEYTELVVAAAGALETDLEKRLFQGLSERLNGVSEKLDEGFRDSYERLLGEKIRTVSGSIDLGEATRKATQDAIQRVQVTAPVAAATTVAGAVSIKLISKAVAKKIVAKVAAKAAGKGVVKGGSILGGAGTGAAICSPAGLAAAACGVVGGVVAWIAVDAVVIQLDELLNREEFVRELRASIDAEKVRVREAMTQQLQHKRAELKRIAPQQAKDLTLAQLPQAQRLEICGPADLLTQNYQLIQTQIAARNSENLAAFATALANASKDDTLRLLAEDMRASIDSGARLARVEQVSFEGNFRTDDRADRDVTAQIRIQGERVEFEQAEATEEEGFHLTSPASIRIDISRDVEVLAAIEQHLRVRSDRLYGGHVTIADIPNMMGDTQGLQGTIQASIPIIRDEEADELSDVRKPAGPSSLMKIKMRIVGEKLRDPMPFSACVDE